MPEREACTPRLICACSSSKLLSTSDDQSTMPWRWPPAQTATPRVSTSGGTPVVATGSANALSQSLTQRLVATAAGPYDVS
eukprot:6714268-Prymnesium_polylepis.1